MLRLATALVTFVLPSASAFSSTTRNKIPARSSATKLNYNRETYGRAVDCANNFGMCSIDELLDLSEELDEFLGCYVEHHPEACEEEIDDRQELSEALLVQGEMMEHEKYIQAGNNIFPYDAAAESPMNDSDSSSPHTSVWTQDDEPFWNNSLAP
eukprot:CAMPEP_0172549518 /NCGR_PEP_ID=MMETSP1067-20121228/18578_1 /TAXON_ID=265564 ORGANISM="Thalassiosira punctigera, Strain Tpunct2005C2" /NCGR_SAMPLE_ID=MMETSP1067 /ASSEMBLY_ACC=CAM_ASM_000444 /LENGTH=154 /DNA_ID=CAMNT_0013336911 /DNA_START=82 /DNA_END=546 /DNA_ORIENTATION=-